VPLELCHLPPAHLPCFSGAATQTTLVLQDGLVWAVDRPLLWSWLMCCGSCSVDQRGIDCDCMLQDRCSGHPLVPHTSN
jgi:hypothetical protein